MGLLLGLLLAAAEEPEHTTADRSDQRNPHDHPDPGEGRSVLAADPVLVRLGEGHCVATDLAAVGVCDLTGEGDGERVSILNVVGGGG